MVRNALKKLSFTCILLTMNDTYQVLIKKEQKQSLGIKLKTILNKKTNRILERNLLKFKQH